MKIVRLPRNFIANLQFTSLNYCFQFETKAQNLSVSQFTFIYRSVLNANVQNGLDEGFGLMKSVFQYRGL